MITCFCFVTNSGSMPQQKETRETIINQEQSRILIRNHVKGRQSRTTRHPKLLCKLQVLLLRSFINWNLIKEYKKQTNNKTFENFLVPFNKTPRFNLFSAFYRLISNLSIFGSLHKNWLSLFLINYPTFYCIHLHHLRLFQQLFAMLQLIKSLSTLKMFT